MVAFIHHSDVADVPFVKLHQLAAAIPDLPLDSFSHFLGAGCIHKDAHCHARAGPFAHRICEPLPEDPLLPQEAFEVHGALRRRYFFDHDIEERAILEDFDRISSYGTAEREAGQRRHEVADCIVTFDPQRWAAMAFHRPDDRHE